MLELCYYNDVWELLFREDEGYNPSTFDVFVSIILLFSQVDDER